MKNFFASAILGWIAMAAVNITTQFTGVMLPVGLLSVGISGILGIPGVILMVILQNIL